MRVRAGCSASEGADVQLELVNGRPVEPDQLSAEVDVTPLQIAEELTVHELVDHLLEMQAGVLDFSVDLAVQLATVLGEDDGAAGEEPELLAEAIEGSFGHEPNPGIPGVKERMAEVRPRECTAEEGQ